MTQKHAKQQEQDMRKIKASLCFFQRLTQFVILNKKKLTKKKGFKKIFKSLRNKHSVKII